MKTATIKIFARSVLLLGVLFLAIAATYFRGETPGITFATYGIDLKIDNRAFYNGLPVPGSTWELKNLIPTSDRFFKFEDIKPGDYGRTIISTHVGKENAFLCIDFTNLTNKENGVNEPESIVDPNGTLTGELAKGTEFFSWLDDGDGIFEPGEKILFGTGTQSATEVLNNKTYIIGDSKEGGECKVNQTRYVGIMWCAGDLSVNTSTGAVLCNGAVLGNAAQTDSFSVDVAIRAVPSRENPDFSCKKEHQEEKRATRTLGFWQTHTEFTSKVFALASMQKFIGTNTNPVSGSHKGKITNIQAPSSSQLFGAYYASISKKTNNSNRTETDKKRMQLLQQLLTAKLNCAAVTCTQATLNLISSADTAYMNGAANMITLSNQLDTYNNSGDAIAFPGSLGNPGSGTPSNSQNIANKAFWDAP